MHISVVICTRNRPERLANAIRSCLRQTAKPLEIIVIDDGDLAPDFLSQIKTEAFAAGIDFVYHHKSIERRGLTISRNIGWQMARGQIIQFIDDDAELNTDCLHWVARIFDADKNNELAGLDFHVNEQSRNRLGRRIIERCYQLAGLWQLGLRFTPHRNPSHLFGAFLSDLRPVRYLQGNCMAIPKTALAAVGGFDEQLADYAAGEDRDISLRLAKRGALARIQAAGIIHHTDPGGRINAYRMGFETSFKYLYINSKNGPLNVGEILLFFYTFSVLLITEGLFALAGDREFHLEQIKGMLSGIRTFAGVTWHNNKG